MEEGSPSKWTWAEVADEDLPEAEAFFAGSPGLLRILGRGPDGVPPFSDSEDLSDSEPSPPSPPPPGKGKEVAGPSRKRHRARRHRHRRGAGNNGFLGAAHRAFQSPPRRAPSPPPIFSVAARPSPSHPARAVGVPNEDGFFLVRSRRCGRRRSPPRSPRQVPPELNGLCFRCLRPGHVKANCHNRPRCYNCWAEGHLAAGCPLPRQPAAVGSERGRSPSGSGGATRPLRRRTYAAGHRQSSVSTSSVSTGRSVVVPPGRGQSPRDADLPRHSPPPLSPTQSTPPGDINYNGYHPTSYYPPVAACDAEATIAVGAVLCPLYGGHASGHYVNFDDRWECTSAPRTPPVSRVEELMAGPGVSPSPLARRPPATPNSYLSKLRKRHFTPPRGVVGQFLAVAPQLLQDGRSWQTPPRSTGVDWWGSLVVNEFLPRAERILLLEASASHDDAALLAVNGCPQVWWDELVDAEFREAASAAAIPPSGAMEGTSAPSDDEVTLPPADSSEDNDDIEAVPAVSPTPVDLVQCMEDRLRAPLQSPLIHGPPRLRRPRTPAPAQPLRRSVRIARTPRELDSNKQARAVLLKKLGVQPSPSAIGEDTAALCKRAFRQPISDASHDNLEKLLGARFDPIALNLDVLGLEESPQR